LTYFVFQGKISKLRDNEEFRWYLRIILVCTAILTILIVFFQNPELQSSIIHPEVWGNFESSFRHSLFQVLSIITTTGFVSADFTMWNSIAIALIFILFFVGGSAGSTSGGVKVVRQVIMIKHSLLELKKQIHPNAIIPVRYNNKGVKPNIVYNILSFFVFYILIALISILIFTVLGMDFYSSIGVTISSLGNVGPGLGSVSPVDNFAHLSDAAKWFSTFLMLLGRLELFTVLMLLTPYFWKKN
jgi:trk system potassium uptake protein TrkH